MMINTLVTVEILIIIVYVSDFEEIIEESPKKGKKIIKKKKPVKRVSVSNSIH